MKPMSRLPHVPLMILLVAGIGWAMTDVAIPILRLAGHWPNWPVAIAAAVVLTCGSMALLMRSRSTLPDPDMTTMLRVLQGLMLIACVALIAHGLNMLLREPNEGTVWRTVTRTLGVVVNVALLVYFRREEHRNRASQAPTTD